MADLAPDGVVVVDREGKVIGFSAAAERITGLAYEEVVGRACEDVLGKEVGMLVRRVLEKGEVLANLELPLSSPEGEVRVWVAVSPLRDVRGDLAGAVVTMRDIQEVTKLAQELYERQEELLREKQKVEAILESIADGVFTVDGDWRVTSFNRAAEEITGFSREEVIGLPCERVFRSPTCRGMCPLRRAFATGGPVYNVEVEITRKDGRQVPISVSAAPLRDVDGVVIGGVEVFRDLSPLRQLSRELEERYSFGQIIGKSKPMRELFALLENVAETDSTVLIYGESGTGKELVARALHYNGPRREGPFVAVNCAALPEALLESELFGYERGAFTGATRSKPGRFELADGGTLFLDEVGEMGLAVQAKLLRVLDQKEFERLGGTKTIRVDVRIIAATNRDLEADVASGRFRRDLFYRLNVVSIHLPPLRERREDIPLLVEHFVRKFGEKMGRKVRSVSPEAMRLLMDYDWPGNVRELENAIEHAFVMMRGDTILPEDLPETIRERKASVVPGGRGLLEDGERQALLAALEQAGWNRGEAARILGISRTTLWRKMRKHGLIHK
mgnify:CR=1 FL=1